MGRLSGTLEAMESKDYTRTDAAMSVAQKRDKAISQDSMIGKNGSIRFGWCNNWCCRCCSC